MQNTERESAQAHAKCINAAIWGSLRRPITDCVRDIEERKQRPSERKRRKGATEKNKRQIGKEGKKKKRGRRPVKRRNLKGEGDGGWRRETTVKE